MCLKRQLTFSLAMLSIFLLLTGVSFGQAELVQHHGNILLGKLGTTDVWSSDYDHPVVIGIEVGIWGRLSLGYRSTNGRYFPYEYSKSEKYAEVLPLRTGKAVRFSFGLRVADDFQGGFRRSQWRFGGSVYCETSLNQRLTMNALYRVMAHWNTSDSRYWYRKNLGGLGASLRLQNKILLRADWEFEWAEQYHANTLTLGLGILVPNFFK